MKNHAGSRWAASGHTDSQGGAAGVTGWLVEQGLEQGRLIPQGFGSTRAVSDNTSPGPRTQLARGGRGRQVNF